MVEAALPFLPGGSHIRQAFIGQAAPSFFYFVITYVTGFMSRNEYRCVVVTEDAITVLESTKWSRREAAEDCRAAAATHAARPGHRPVGRSRPTRLGDCAPYHWVRGWSG